MTIRERVNGATNRVYDRLRHPAAFQVRPADAVAGSFEVLRGHKFGLLVTFRRTGEPVPSPVWMAVDDAGLVYVSTGARTGKVRRISRDGTVLIAPSTFRGRPTGPVLLGAARILPASAWPHAEATLAAGFGLDRRVYRRLEGASPADSAYLQIAPVDA